MSSEYLFAAYLFFTLKPIRSTYVVWLKHRFSLGCRNVDEILAEYAIIVSCAAIRL